MGESKKAAVGAFVVGGFLLFAIGLFLIGDRRQLFSSSVELQAEYTEVASLQVGAPVRVGGLNAGEVLEIRVPPSPEGKFLVRFRVLEDFKPVLRTDSVASIQTDGLVGNKFLQVDAGTSGASEVQDGSTIKSREPFEFADLMQEVSDTVKSINQTVTDVKGEFDDAFKAVSDTAKTANELITNASDDIKKISASGNRISTDISGIIDGVKSGRGTVGKLFTDDQLYSNVRASVDEIEKTARNFRKTSDDVQSMVNDLKSRDVMKNVDETLENVKEATARARKAISDFQPEAGNGLSADLRQTLAGARETMEDFSENSEALKRSWFFRGFFKKRGFYDLDSISVQDYKDGKAAPGYPSKRAWLTAYELFTVNIDGTENLTDEGKRAIDRAVAEFLPYAKDQPIVIEGYSGQGSGVDQFVRSHERAHLVRDYLLKRFFLKSNYVGVMQMGAAQSPQGQQGPYEGVSLVLFSPIAPGKMN